MSFAALNYDFSQLPKVRSHAQLGSLGQSSQEASDALADAHNLVIDFATAASDFYNDAVVNGAPSELLNALQESKDDARQLVIDHTAMMNAFYAQTGMSGLWKDSGGTAGLGRLGQGPLPVLLGLALRQIYWSAIWVYIASIIGRIADAFKSHTDEAQANLNTRGNYYLAWKAAKEQGVTPPPPPDNLGGSSFLGGDMTTLFLIGGATILAVMLLTKR